MVKAEELELFEFLSRQHKLREWINDKLAEDTKVLIQSTDLDQLRKAQGRAQCWQSMLVLMDKAPAASKR